MAKEKQINVRGGINSLEVGEAFIVSRKDRTPHNVRTTAYMLADDTGKSFSVITTENEITVTRTL